MKTKNNKTYNYFVAGTRQKDVAEIDLGGFSRKLFQGIYSEFDLEIVHDSKYVT